MHETPFFSENWRLRHTGMGHPRNGGDGPDPTGLGRLFTAEGSTTACETVANRLAACLAALVCVLACADICHGQTTFFVQLSGAPNPSAPGLAPHGDPLVSGVATLTIYGNNTMDYEIVLEDDRYEVTQAHLYNMNFTSGTSGDPAHGDSIICWGGRWANGGDSDDFLTGTGYSNGRLAQVAADPSDWFLILHTAGGHFATDASGGLIPYDPIVHEINELGVPETERPTRFNNRVGRKLDSLVLREDNNRDPAAPFYNPSLVSNWNDAPYPDAQGETWLEADGSGGWQLTTEALAAGYDLSTEYLFYLYDDQGPTWDFGGPEGALSGELSTSVGAPGDLNLDGVVDTSDWLQMIANYETELAGLTPLEAFQAGDLNGDRIHTLADIDLFRSAYVASGGDLTKLVAAIVPEPSGACLAVALLAVVYSRRGAIRVAVSTRPPPLDSST